LKHILLVDDDEDDRDFFRSVLTSIESSLVYQAAENGQDALQKLNSGIPLPDLIFLDLNMPVMGGKQFLAEVKKRSHLKDIPIVILSTSSDKATISDTIDLGAVEFLTKPNKLSLLEGRLREILNNPTYHRK